MSLDIPPSPDLSDDIESRTEQLDKEIAEREQKENELMMWSEQREAKTEGRAQLKKVQEELSELKKERAELNIPRATSYDELYKATGELGIIPSSNGSMSASVVADLIGLIEDNPDTDLSLKGIPRAYGIRDKVEELRSQQ